jgi:hypothetical protein
MNSIEVAGKISDINSAIPGAISAAVLGGCIVIATKIYDHYSNKPIRELKEIVDIAKESNTLPESAKESVNLLLEERADNFVNYTSRHLRFGKQSEKFQDKYSGSKMMMFISLFATVVLVVLAIILDAMNIEKELINVQFWAGFSILYFIYFLIRMNVLSKKFDKGNHRIKNKTLGQKVKGFFNRK